MAGTVIDLYDGLRGFIRGMTGPQIGPSSKRYSPEICAIDGIEAFRTSWVARKAHTIIPTDMVREWRDWQAEKKDIQLIEKEEERIGLEPKIRKALIWSRLYGGAAMLIGVNQGDVTQPLRVNALGKDSLRFIHVISAEKIRPGEIVRDVTSEFFGQPSFYSVTGDRGETRIHPSRIIRFRNDDLPDEAGMLEIHPGWGDPLWQSIRQAVLNADSSQLSIAKLMDQVKSDTIRIPGLSEKIATKEGEERLTNRVQLSSQIQASLNTRILDAGNGMPGSGEEWEQWQASFAGLPDIIMAFIACVSGATDIPITRFIGKSADGMNATGEGDMNNYFDVIRSRQKFELKPGLLMLDEVLLRSALGTKPDEIHWNYAPLHIPDDKTLAETDKSRMETSAGYVNGNLVPVEVMAQAIRTQLVENQVYPGIEAAYDDYDNGLLVAPVEEDADVDPVTGEPIDPAQTGQRRVAANDAAPRSLYVRRNLKNADDLIRWAKSQGFETTTPAEEMHVTITFSRNQVDWMKMGQAWQDKLEIGAGGARLVEKLGDKGAVALLFNSSDLSWRHQEMKREGASWDYPEYQPHVTITYQGGDVDLKTVEPYRGKLIFGEEIFEEVVEDWEKGITEK